MATNPNPNSRDLGFIGILLLVATIAVWLFWMPWSAEISRASMRRFHLQGESFLAWAVQFPIPAMYNFSNRAEITRYPPGLVDPLLDQTHTGYLNHFPIRCVTFADGRYRHLRDKNDRWVTVVSSYRGRHVESRFHVRSKAEGGFELLRLAKENAP